MQRFAVLGLCAFLCAEEVGQMQLPTVFITGKTLITLDTSIQTPQFRNNKLSYIHTNMTASYTHFCEPSWGWIAGGGVVLTHLNWKTNPFFKQQDFSYVTLTGGLITQSMEQWTWTSTLTCMFNYYSWNPITYALYRNITWGKYTYNDCFTLHIGYIFEIGLLKEKIWPILGGQWSCAPHWKWNVVYPLHLALDYAWQHNLTFSATLRPFWDHYRTKKEEPLSKGLFYYRCWGSDLEGTWNITPNIVATGCLGCTWKADLKISNQHNKEDTQIHLKKAPYIGASLRMSF